MTLRFRDHREDPAAWARSLGVSVEACELLLASPFIDLHLDLEVPVRVFGYDPAKHHGAASRPPRFWRHTDYPRIREAGFTGIVYDIATNPFRSWSDRLQITLENVAAVQARIDAHPDDLELVWSATGYDRAQQAGRTAMWLSLQGANALSADPSVLQGSLGKLLHRITLVHLTTSRLGGTNSPAGPDHGCTELGREMVERMNRARVLVDLAHAGRRTFWEALEVHDATLPPIVSHTGVDAVRPHWRNVDDAQIRAIAERGGVVGIMYQSSFLAEGPRCPRSAIVDHLEHVIRVGGEGAAAIGTDYDGMVLPPHDLPDVTHHPLLVQDMMDRGWSPDRIQGVLGGNYLRVARAIRP